MKNIYTLSILLVLSLSAVAKNYYTYTAKQSGNWENAATWTAVLRNDNVQKDKFIIPGTYKVIAGEDVNGMGYSDVELQISGILELGSSATLRFGNNSSIQILSTGSIEGNGASQQIYIGAVSKYIGNMNKTLTGPVYADYSTGAAPAGFSSFSLLSLNNNNNTASVRQNEASNATVIYASNKNINIRFNTEVRSTVKVTVMNMSGEVVANESLSRPSANVSLNMNNLKSGVYVVCLTSNNTTPSLKKIFLN